MHQLVLQLLLRLLPRLLPLVVLVAEPVVLFLNKEYEVVRRCFAASSPDR